MSLLLNSLLDKLALGIMLVDKDHRIVFWNGWLERVSGLPRFEVLGEKVAKICPCFTELKFRRMLVNAIVEGQNRFCSGMLHQTFVFRRDGENIPEIKRQNMQIEPLEYEGDVFALIQITDITMQYRRVSCLQNLIKRLETDYQAVKKAEEDARQSAFYDSLTGLCNRRLLFQRLKCLLTESSGNGRLLAVLFIDLDRFKEVNDTYGHSIGDILLKKVAIRIKHTVRSTDTVARLAGDEFVVILANLHTPDEAHAIAHKIRRSIGEKFNLSSITLSITASIGISFYPADANNARGLLKKADSAMYSVKTHGKNDCRFYKKPAALPPVKKYP